MKIRKLIIIASIVATSMLGGAVFGQSTLEALARSSSSSSTEQPDQATINSLLGELSQRQFTYFYNSFLGENKVLSLDGSNQLIMATKNSNDERQHWKVVQGEGNNYFHLWNRAKGESLRIDSDTSKPHMAASGNYTGQAWVMTKEANGWYRLSNHYQGLNKVLDTYNLPGNALFLENKSSNTSGTYWRMETYEVSQ